MTAGVKSGVWSLIVQYPFQGMESNIDNGNELNVGKRVLNKLELLVGDAYGGIRHGFVIGFRIVWCFHYVKHSEVDAFYIMPAYKCHFSQINIKRCFPIIDCIPGSLQIISVS